MTEVQGKPAIQGQCAGPFEAVRSALEANLASGEELGASVWMNVAGETVIDMWGGHRDAARTVPWDEHTITNVWSTTKTITSLAALMLVDRGELDVFAPVARYWPEFAASGKGEIEVRHLMSHTSGVSGWERPFAIEDMYDWDSATARLAAQAPWWEPGTASGYHANNQGHLVGEVIRRITGQHLKDFVAAEIAGPIGADFQIGAKEADWGRIANVVPPPPLPFDLNALPDDNVAKRTFLGPEADANAANTPGWRKADMGALNGHGNARSVGRIMSALSLGGETEGHRLLSPATIELIFQEQAHGPDLVLGVPLRFGIGYGLPVPETIASHPGQQDLLLGRLGRLDDHHGRGPPGDVLLHDEQHGRGRRRLAAQRRLPDRRLPGPGRLARPKSLACPHRQRAGWRMTGPAAEGVRVDWAGLPAAVRAAVEQACGSPVARAVTQPGGFSPGAAARLSCADGRRFFVKAVSAEANPDSPKMHRRESRVLAALGPLIDDGRVPAPRLRAVIDQPPWIALLLDDVDGVHPDLPWQPGQLSQVLAATDRLAAALTPPPTELTAVGLRLGRMLHGWRDLAAAGGADGLDAWSATAPGRPGRAGGDLARALGRPHPAAR